MAEHNNQIRTRVGGGVKKVLYTLNKVRHMGLRPAGKALSSRNTCKACGLGMGGQLGGMTNESGEFPSVCNKSVQAQSTDVQPPIPEAVFAHSITDLKELNEREMATLGRLNTPLIKTLEGTQLKPVSWEEALQRAGDALQGTSPDRSFFYSSGRSSNEAGFLLQLFARLFGTNNVNNCSYYCHQATGVALSATVGTGTATVELEDIAKADLFFLIGANPASNHPRLLHQLQLVRENGGKIVVINPAKESGLVRFAVPKSPRSLIAGGTEIASHYLQPRVGTDYLLLQGIAKALLELGRINQTFIEHHTRQFQEFKASLSSLSWDAISACGIEPSTIVEIAEVYGASKNTIFAWGMGVTHHTHGVNNVEQIANLAMMRGMVGKPAAGLLPLRGHSNVQGIGTIGVKPVLAADVLERMTSHFEVHFPETPGLDTMGCMQAAASGEIDLALIMGGNLYASNPNSTWAAGALDKIKTKIFLTTTLNRGHIHGHDNSEVIILPVAARDEEWEPTTQESMFNFVRLSDGGINRLDNVKPESWVIAKLADQVLGSTPVDFKRLASHRTIREAIADILPELADLKDIDVAKREFHIRNRLLHTPDFSTPDGKVSFAAVHCAEPPSAELMLTTVRSEGQFNSIVYEDEDVYRGTTSRWCVMMSPADMNARQLTRGSRVTLRSANGVMEGLEVIPFDLPEGNLMCYYPEANVLTSTLVDERSKTPAFKATAVTLETAAG